MRVFFSALLLLTIVGTIGSCKEGCKDKSALNYDSKATVENATCLYCKDGYVADTAVYFFAISDSQGVTQTTNNIELILINTNANISGNGCHSIGKQVSSKCSNYLSIVNLTNRNAEGFIEVAFVQNGNDAWFFENPQTFFLGPPGSGTDTLNFGLADSTTCSNLTTGTMSILNEQIQFF
jgi:hypothetical protein